MQVVDICANKFLLFRLWLYIHLISSITARPYADSDQRGEGRLISVCSDERVEQEPKGLPRLQGSAASSGPRLSAPHESMSPTPDTRLHYICVTELLTTSVFK